MKTNHITLFLSSVSTPMGIDRLSNKKLKKLTDILDLINTEDYPSRRCFHVFKHNGHRYFIRPDEVSMYVVQTETIRL